MGILEEAKTIASAVQEINNLELYKRVLALHSDIIAIVEENKRLHEENTNLRGNLATRARMAFKPPFFFQDGDETPFCAPCWESKNLAAHLVHAFENEERTRWECPTCKYSLNVHKVAGNPMFRYRGPTGSYT